MLLTFVTLFTNITQQAPKAPGSFFDITTLESLGGSSFAVLLFCNMSQSIFNFNPKWLSLLIAVLISYALALHDQSNTDPMKYIIAFFNGLLIWFTAIGGNTATSRINPSSGSSGSAFSAQSGSKRRFNENWF